MLVNGGVGNTQCALIIHEIAEQGIPLARPREFLAECILPKKFGKVSTAWLDQARVKEETLSSFASIMLTVIPILACFLTDCVQPHLEDGDALLDHISCFVLLSHIIGLLTMGADDAMQHMDELHDLIIEHHRMFVDLYESSHCKPKFHHLLHLVENFRRLKKVISCFVTERKHRATKRAALHVFRHLESTVLATLINEQCEQVLEGYSLFQKEFLAHPRVVDFFGTQLLRSTEAVLQCGHIHAEDIVCLKGNGVVARVVMFWQQDLGADIILQCTLCQPVEGEHRYRDSQQAHFVSVSELIDACIHRYLRNGAIRVVLPFHAKYHRR